MALEEEVKVEANEDAEVDKILEESLATIRAENKVVVPPIATPPIDDKGTPPAKPVVEEPTSPAIPPKEETNADDPNTVLVEAFKTPTKGKFESEESYQKRLDLADLVAKRKAASTVDEKAKLSADISNARRELSTLNNGDRITKPNNGDAPNDPAEPVIDESLEADKAKLKSLGGLTKEDMEIMFQKERFDGEVKSTLQQFVDRHPELKSDEDTREVFFDFVDANYAWQNKTGKDLMTVLELARENMFKPSETIQERVLKGANVAEKVNAMQFPGGTIVKPAMSAEQRKSVDEMVATGMSEEKALELISD